MKSEEELLKRSKRFLEENGVQEAKNKKLADNSSHEFVRSVLKEKEMKDSQHTRAAIYTVFTVIYFLIFPPFGVFLFLFFIADSIFNFLKLKK